MFRRKRKETQVKRLAKYKFVYSAFGGKNYMFRTSKNVYLGPIRAVKTDTHFHRIEPAEIA